MDQQILSFELRVAVLGHVSAGKSTVINALLQGKFSQVGLRRTTAGVNSFRIHHPTISIQQAQSGGSSSASSSISGTDEPLTASLGGFVQI